MSSHFANVKDIFLEGDVFDYITLDKSVLVYEKLIESLKKPLKLILFFGKPGTGKTFLLRKIYQDLSQAQNIIFFPQPFFDESSFLTTLYENIFKNKPKYEIRGYEEFLRLYKEETQGYSKRKVVTVLLDEAQLYPQDLIEKIRLLADTRLFKFLFTVHKTEKEDVLAKDYFTTRIWESIKLPNSSAEEIANYLEKKFLLHKKFEYFSLFSQKHISLMFDITGGNLRTINKLMYKFFEICEYYEKYAPSTVSVKRAKTKHLEMAAISTGLIRA